MAKYRLPLIDSREIIFKSLPAEDADRYYQAILNSNSNPELEEYIFNLITEDKYVDQFNTLEPGIILTVIYASFSLSNVITEVKEFPSLIEEARSKTDTLYSMLYVKILQAMPYTLDVLKQKSLNELLELFTISENITGKPVDIAKLREMLKAPAQKSKTNKPNLNKDELESLKHQLDVFQSADFDEMGKFIGDGNMM